MSAIKFIEPPFEESKLSAVREIIISEKNPPNEWTNYVFNNPVSAFTSLITAEAYIKDVMFKNNNNNRSGSNAKSNRRTVINPEVKKVSKQMSKIYYKMLPVKVKCKVFAKNIIKQFQ